MSALACNVVTGCRWCFTGSPPKAYVTAPHRCADGRHAGPRSGVRAARRARSVPRINAWMGSGKHNRDMKALAMRLVIDINEDIYELIRSFVNLTDFDSVEEFLADYVNQSRPMLERMNQFAAAVYGVPKERQSELLGELLKQAEIDDELDAGVEALDKAFAAIEAKAVAMSEDKTPDL